MYCIPKLLRAGFYLSVIIGMTASLMAQSHSYQISDDKEMFMIPEVGAMLTSVDDVVTVEMIPSANETPKAYRDVYLQYGDIIMMANGKKITSASALEEMYEALEVGAQIKMGIKRDKGMLMTSFNKADEKDLPKRKVMMMSMGGDGEGTMTTTEGGMTKTMTFSGDGEALSVIPELGLLLVVKEDQLVLANLLPNAVAVFGEDKIFEGDILAEINGTIVTTTTNFEEIYNAIEIGNMFSLKFLQDGAEYSTTIKKPEAHSGGMMIRKKTE